MTPTPPLDLPRTSFMALVPMILSSLVPLVMDSIQFGSLIVNMQFLINSIICSTFCSRDICIPEFQNTKG